MSHSSHGMGHPSVRMSVQEVKMTPCFVHFACWSVLRHASIERFCLHFLPSGPSSVRTNHSAKRMSHRAEHTRLPSYGSKRPALRTKEPAGGMNDCSVLPGDFSHGSRRPAVHTNDSAGGMDESSVLPSDSYHGSKRPAVRTNDSAGRMNEPSVLPGHPSYGTGNSSVRMSHGKVVFCPICPFFE
ncbi:hypothetical protein SAMN05421788_105139 [Filimonas lacunae]|uniref:Uncharacterized protein n=1 Tax=Filimonas lacunae TaxID=477680 RepID=A0A173MD14_9BACT|nr:hypothetical protein FLA_1414 [Filimonas lacunae]SIT21365.1 hypothetical protein SAMN05421788_105139 [Filimonas lacunae]